MFAHHHRGDAPVSPREGRLLLDVDVEEEIKLLLVMLGFHADAACRMSQSLAACGFGAAMGDSQCHDDSVKDHPCLLLMEMLHGVSADELADAGMPRDEAAELVGRIAAFDLFAHEVEELHSTHRRIQESGMPSIGWRLRQAQEITPLREREGIVCVRLKLALPPPTGSSRNPYPRDAASHGAQPGAQRGVKFAPLVFSSAAHEPSEKDTSEGIEELVVLVEQAAATAAAKGAGRKQMQCLLDAMAELALAANSAGIDELPVRGLTSRLVWGPASSTVDQVLSARRGQLAGRAERAGQQAPETFTPKELLARAIRIDPLHGPSFLALAQILANTESVRLLDGRELSKVEAAVEAVRLLPSRYDSYLTLGNALLSDPAKEVDVLGDSGGERRVLDCRRALLHALQLRPNCAEALTKLGTVMQRSETLQLLPVASGSAGSITAPGSVRKGSGLGEISDSGHVLTKRMCYIQAVQADPCYAPAYFGLGNLLGPGETVDLDHGVRLTKRECFTQTLILHPRHSAARSSLALCLSSDEQVALPDGTVVTSSQRHNPRRWLGQPMRRGESPSAGSAQVVQGSSLVDQQLSEMARSDAHRQQLTFGKQERHTSTGRSQMFFPQNRASTTTISPAANVSSLDFDVYGVVNPAASAAGGAASSFMRSFGVDQAPDRLAADAATEQNQHASQTPRSNLTLSEAPHREHGGVVLRPYRGTSSR